MIEPQKIVDHARRTGRLKLSFGDAMHFCGGYIPIAAIVVNIIFLMVFGSEVLENGTILCVDSIAVIAFAIMFTFRRRALKFTVVETKLPRERVLLLMQEIIEYYGWVVKVSDRDIVVADYIIYLDRSFDPPFDIIRNCGERITVVFDSGRVLINSIYNIDRFSRLREGGWPKHNRENVDIIREEIEIEEEAMTQGGII